MLEFINKIRNIGIIATDDIVEKGRNRLMMEIALANLVVALIVLVVGLVTLQIPFLVYGFVPIVLSWVIYELHHRRLFMIVRYIVFIVVPPTLLYVWTQLGSSIDFVHMFLLMVIGTIVFFTKSAERVIFITYTLSCYYIGNIYLFNHSAPLEDEITHWHGLIFFYVSVISIIFIVDKFSTLSSSAESHIEAFMKVFKKSNSKLEEKEAFLNEQNQELIAANKELEKFMYVASHDLKAPLRSISSFISLIQRKLKDSEDQDIHEYLAFTTNSAIQMQQLVDDILTFSRVGQEVNIETVDLNQALQVVQSALQSEITNSSTIIQSEHLPSLKVDKNLMELLFLHLINNAILYNENEVPRIDIQYYFEKNQHIIKVKDNGIGIGEEHFERIFKMFKRLHTQVEYQGSGIGLSICKKIVELFDGKIMVESQLGKGSTFSIKI